MTFLSTSLPEELREELKTLSSELPPLKEPASLQLTVLRTGPYLVDGVEPVLEGVCIHKDRRLQDFNIDPVMVHRSEVLELYVRIRESILSKRMAK